MRVSCLAIAVVASGCATFGMRVDGARLSSLVEEGRSRGLKIEDPLEIDDAIREAAVVQVGKQGTELDRLRRLNAWLRGAHGLGFTYDGAATRTAREAFQARSGDCLSYAHLFTAMARHI